MVLDQRALLGHRRGVDVVDDLHRVRIAHRQHRHRHDRAAGMRAQARGARCASAPSGCGSRPAASKGTRAGSKIGRAHVDRRRGRRRPCAARSRPTASARARRPWSVRPCSRTKRRKQRAPLPHCSTSPPSALWITYWKSMPAPGDGRTDEDLVGADAEMAVGQEAVLRGDEAQRRAGLVQHDEVVAGALHLGKANSHRRIIGRAPPHGQVGAARRTTPMLFHPECPTHARSPPTPRLGAASPDDWAACSEGNDWQIGYRGFRLGRGSPCALGVLFVAVLVLRLRRPRETPVVALVRRRRELMSQAAAARGRRNGRVNAARIVALAQRAPTPSRCWKPRWTAPNA